eukprot:c11107_g1_i1.p1 GENE.c11107_g1_i1~~c11107_g1_i1.p1  ORF type:complete len:472 (+),score=93.80 c11107_g1_i1:39-1418(+)
MAGFGAFEQEQRDAMAAGPLLKQQRRISSTWVTRFYLIKGDNLVYYQSNMDTVPKKVIWLKDTQVIPFFRKDQGKFGFLLQTSARTHTLFASSQEEAERWIAAIQAVNKPESKPKTHHAEPKASAPSSGPAPTPQLLRSRSRAANKIEDYYDVREELGTGGFAVVKKGICKADGKAYALKMIRNSVFLKNKERTEEEVSVQMSLDHPNIVKIKEVVKTAKFFVIVMELLTGKELFDRVVSREKYSEHDAKIVVVKLLGAVKYIHDNNVVHRDLKPENLIFDRPGDDAELKLTDFGFATLYDPKKKLTATCGTPEYVAPEILDEKPYGKSVDMWSCGVIIYILLCGFPPFYGDSENELFDRICSAKYKFLSPYWDKVSWEAKDLIRHLLELDTSKRFTADQALEHKWLQDIHIVSDAPAADLSGALSELKRYNATRKFKKAVLAVIAANKIRNIMLRPKA